MIENEKFYLNYRFRDVLKQQWCFSHIPFSTDNKEQVAEYDAGLTLYQGWKTVVYLSSVMARVK